MNGKETRTNTTWFANEGMGGTNKNFKEGKLKKLLVFMGILCLIMPLLFLGCEGDDGAAGATGTPGQPGPPGPVTDTDESCEVCHGTNKIADVAVFMPDPTAHDLVVDNLALTNTGGFGVVSFDLKDATDDNASVTTLLANQARLYIADLVPADNTNSFSDYFQRWTQERSTPDTSGPVSHFQWTSFTNNGGGNYTIVMSTSLDNAVDPLDVQRLYLRISGVTSGSTSFNPVAGILDFVIPAVGGTVTAADLAQRQKAYVTVEACKKCHGDPLQGVAHGSSYADTLACVVCHSPLLDDPAILAEDPNLPVVINASTFFHKIHAAIEVPEFPDRYFINGEERSYDAVTFPQEVNNCVLCHNDGGNDLTGTAAAIDNWKTHPTIEACASCHGVTFSGAGATHSGGVVPPTSCSGCHPPEGSPSVGGSVTAVHIGALVPSGADAPEFDVTISRTDYPNGTHYVAGDNVLVTVTLKNHADNTDVAPSVYTAASDAEGSAGGGLSTANLYVYGPRAKSVPVLTTNSTTDPAWNDNTVPTQSHSLFVGGTDPLVATDNTGFKYQLMTIPAGMAPGTYMMHFEGADFGGIADNNYVTSSTATITFQIGTATPSLKVAGDSCLDCHGNTRMHLQGSHAHNVPFDTDSCLACHDQSENRGDPLSNRAHAIHSANNDGDLTNITAPNPSRDWSEVTYPQVLRNDETGELSSGVRCLACHNSGNTAYKTNPYTTPCAGCHVREGNGVLDHMRQNGSPW